MAQYYTLDEAAQKLGLKIDEFRKRLATEWKTIRRFPDGANLRFQAREIDELARTLGRLSDPDVQIGEAPLTLADEPAPPIASKKPADATVFLADSDDEFVPLALDDHAMSDSGKKKKSGSDSDVKLEKASKAAKGQPGHDEPTEVLKLSDDIKAKPKYDVKSDSPKKSGRTINVASEFDLNLNADSDDFELQLSDDDSDEVDLGAPARKSSTKGGDSGISLGDPADSGISLERDSSEFELQLDAGSSGAGKAEAKTDRDSEFELTLDDPTGSDMAASPLESDQKDIFETDFELPAIDDSSSEDKTPSEDSDFDLSIDEDAAAEESGSEVVAIEEEAEDDLEPIEEDLDAAPRPLATAPAVSHDWGILPVVFLAPCVLLMFFVGLMSYELVRSTYGHYHVDNKPSAGIVRMLAEVFNGGKFKD